ncbi:MAG: 4Fe-4S dicluster domain-containing protein, partial [Elusimicrobia bacterium]|nr:4Fe-4S dicluster domain-containing protein [Elusimicrobiota bacterium]
VQAGIEVAGLAEGAPQVGGYKVHADKIKRLGIPVYTSHTVLRAEGRERLEKVVLAQVDAKWKPVPGTEKEFAVDTLLVAVGLNPCDELYAQASAFGMNVYAAGDAQEIAEASAAMFSGRIAGRQIALNLGLSHEPAPAEWEAKLNILKSRPGATTPRRAPAASSGVFPVFHCTQEIPCNPCVSVCPQKAIKLRGPEITNLPEFDGTCIGCGKCVAICPGLAVTLLDFRQDANFPLVGLPFEIGRGILKPGDFVKVTDVDGREMADAEVARIQDLKAASTLLVFVKVDKSLAPSVAGLKLYAQPQPRAPEVSAAATTPDDAIICRCERVTAGEIRKAIRGGVRDMNQLKALTRAGMGACGGKTCQTQIMALFRAEGVKPEEVTQNTLRPLVMEVPLGQFANARKKAGRHPGFDAGKY